MKNDLEGDIAQRLGADRVLEPRGSLPQRAARLDASGPVRDFELELEVERLCLDATSFAELRRRQGGEPAAIAERIAAIVAERGKMHNPATDSGGILLGTVRAFGGRLSSPPAVGTRVATLGSLTLTPLRLDAVTRVDADSPQVEVAGTAYVSERAAWAPVPDDLPAASALEIFDVCAAPSQVRELAPEAGTVCVLGVGHAGKLALAAARDSVARGTVVAVDRDPEALERVRELGLCDLAVAADLREPLAARAALRAAGAPPAELTVSVVSAPGCEPAAILLTADGGTVLFFSMATSFSAAALAADGIGTDVSLRIGSGLAPDRGAYALELVRRLPAVRAALGVPAREPA